MSLILSEILEHRIGPVNDRIDIRIVKRTADSGQLLQFRFGFFKGVNIPKVIFAILQQCRTENPVVEVIQRYAFLPLGKPFVDSQDRFVFRSSFIG